VNWSCQGQYARNGMPDSLAEITEIEPTCRVHERSLLSNMATSRPMSASLVRTLVSLALDSPSFPISLWLCKSRSFSATKKFSPALAVALFHLVNAQSSSSVQAGTVTPGSSTRTSSAPLATHSTAVPPSNSTHINVSPVLSVAPIFR